MTSSRRERSETERRDEAIERAAAVPARVIETARAQGKGAAMGSGNPLDVYRDVAGLSGLEWAREQRPHMPFGTTLTSARTRWVAHLAVLRVELPFVARIEAIVTEPDLADHARSEAHVVEKRPYRTLLREWITRRASDARAERAHRDEAWRALEARASALASDLGELHERRFEAARRAHLAHPESAGLQMAPALVAQTAEHFLRATDDLARDTLARARLRYDAVTPRDFYLEHVLAADACDPFPPRPRSHWFQDLFGPLGRTYAPRDAAFAEDPAGASTFARALGTFGRTLAHARLDVQTTMPFPLRRDPRDASLHEAEALFAGLVTHAPFLVRRLDVDRGRARDVAVRLTAMTLADARHRATCALLGMTARPSRDDFDEACLRAYGFTLPPSLSLAWPWPSPAAPPPLGRFVAALEAHRYFVALVDRHDDDWFANPRAHRDLEGHYMSARSPHGLTTSDDTAQDAHVALDAATRFARAFEGQLA